MDFFFPNIASSANRYVIYCNHSSLGNSAPDVNIASSANGDLVL